MLGFAWLVGPSQLKEVGAGALGLLLAALGMLVRWVMYTAVLPPGLDAGALDCKTSVFGSRPFNTG